MEWPKLKNIIIILLACVNLFLLVLALHREHESQGYSESAREDAITVLWNACRIELDRDLLPEDMTLPVMVVERDPELERQQAAVLLGELSDDGGDAMRYEGALGTAQFYINGAFSAEFHPGAYPVCEETPEDFSLTLMERLDIEAQVVSADTGGWEMGDIVVQQRSVDVDALMTMVLVTVVILWIILRRASGNYFLGGFGGWFWPHHHGGPRPPHGGPSGGSGGFGGFGGGSGRGSGAGRRSGGGCACACACVSCACACACAGGGRAGCSAKDFKGAVDAAAL